MKQFAHLPTNLPEEPVDDTYPADPAGRRPLSKINVDELDDTYPTDPAGRRPLSKINVDELAGETALSAQPKPAHRVCSLVSSTILALVALAIVGFATFKGTREGTNSRELLSIVLGTDTSTTTTTVSTTITTTSTTITMTTSTSPRHPPPTSLFCFSLVMPWGSTEPGLLRWQRSENKSIFACDEYAVYSNTTSEDLDGLEPKIVNHTLYAPIGGQWHTALNTWIFMALWDQVYKDGQFHFAAWTVKVDADAVFLPQRLRAIVGDPAHVSAAEEWNGAFSNNCEAKGSLHGAVEVLSRRALEVYATRNWPNCPRPMQEDYYLHECLVYLGVRPMNDFQILSELYCTSDWSGCTSARVTFHPYKTLQSYQACLSNAELRGNWWVW